MAFQTTLHGTVYKFSDIKSVLAKANEEKSGDTLLGVGASSVSERVAARIVLADITLGELRANPVIPYEQDAVTRVIEDNVNDTIFADYSSMTVGEFREYILDHKTTSTMLSRVSMAMTGEIVAAVAKLMTNMDLVFAAKKMGIASTCAHTIGRPGTISSRIQPNHPTDNIQGIIASTLEGLSYGTGDAVLGVNPVDDTVDNLKRIMEVLHTIKTDLQVPTQTCVLGHIVSQMDAVRAGAPVSMLFQSVAGTESANTAFGIDKDILDEGYKLIHKYGTAQGPNLMYFETGQGSEMSLDCDGGADEMTLEARCYGFARIYKPFMVNNVSGFIGPETLYDGKQIIRASLEDHFMGKLFGLPMGMAPCYTNHTNIDQNDQETATMLLAMAGSSYFMSIPVGDDVMLSYQDTSCHDDATLREILGYTPAEDFFKWAIERGVLNEKGVLTERAGDPTMFGYRGGI